jgi:two-component system NtrC family sensor kinase
VATIAYFQHLENARDRLQLRLGHAYEHALKVFDTVELSAKYAEELFSDLPDEQIRAAEIEYSARLRAIVATLPQLRDISVIDATGRPLVAGAAGPLPPGLDLSDRRYFAVHKTNQIPGDYISEVLPGRATDLPFFAVTRRRSDPRTGAFHGIIAVALAPEYFADYYARITAPEHGMTALVRDDGQVLARHPQPPAASLDYGAPFVHMLASGAPTGTVTAVSPIDGIERLFAYRRLPRHGAFVLAGFDSGAVTRAWLISLRNYLSFGVPAVIAMASLAWMALTRARRESLAYARLREEIARRETTEQALRQSHKMEAVGRLTGGIAHDFNNLLTAILGNIDMTLRRLENGDDRIRRSLSSAREAGHRAAALVQRLLAFSRQQPLEVKVIDLNRLVQDMSELLRRSLGEATAVETVLAGGLWRTAVDPNQLENAILNLAINARDAMAGAGRLTIETGNSYLDETYVALHGDGITAGQYVLLAITDSGTGMTKGVTERAFEPFFTTKPAGVGTGLGLSMVYGFVRQSGGHIKIYSEPGEGTTIKIYLPRVMREPEIERVDAFSRPPTMVATGREKILLVEDDEELNRFGSEVLRELGYTVVSASDGPNALRLMEQHPDVDLLFTDVILPNGMNGRELASAAQSRRTELKVLFTTGYTRNAIVHDGRLDPGVELLTKPFTFETLARKVRQVLEKPGLAS